jgi:hypothetical protein
MNLVRPKVRTNYGVHTFKFISSKIWETIDIDIKKLSSLILFKKGYMNILLHNQY